MLNRNTFRGPEGMTPSPWWWNIPWEEAEKMGGFTPTKRVFKQGRYRKMTNDNKHDKPLDKVKFLGWFSHSFQTKETAPAAEPLAKLLAQGRWAGWPGKASCLTSITWDRRHMGHDWGVTHKSRCPWMMLDDAGWFISWKSEHKMDDLGIPQPYLWNQLKIHMQKPLLDELF